MEGNRKDIELVKTIQFSEHFTVGTIPDPGKVLPNKNKLSIRQCIRIDKSQWKMGMLSQESRISSRVVSLTGSSLTPDWDFEQL